MQELTCIVCPNGCRISVEFKDGDYVFSGNKCVRGIEFARAELTAPTRSVTTTVKTAFSGMPVLPVRTNGEIPKKMIPVLIHALASVVVTQPVGIGETVIEDVLGTGCDVIATSDILKPADMKEGLPC